LLTDTQNLTKTASIKWFWKARAGIEHFRKIEMDKSEKLKALLQHLEDEIAMVESCIENEKERM
jgi:hypothetical protein